MMDGKRGWPRVTRSGCVRVAVLVVAVFLCGCGLADAPPAKPTAAVVNANVIDNGGFERDDAGWLRTGAAISDPAAFQASDERAHGGSKSAKVVLTSADVDGPAGGAGISQPLPGFPEFVSGFYYVDAWAGQAALQYVQFSLLIKGGDLDDGAPTHELRFVIGAATEPPAEPNVSYVFLNRDAPTIGRWTYFGYPVAHAFQSHFQRLPFRWDGIDLGLSVQVEGSTPRQADSIATVYFDDVYAGTQLDNSNRPSDP